MLPNSMRSEGRCFPVGVAGRGEHRARGLAQPVVADDRRAGVVAGHDDRPVRRCHRLAEPVHAGVDRIWIGLCGRAGELGHQWCDVGLDRGGAHRACLSVVEVRRADARSRCWSRFWRLALHASGDRTLRCRHDSCGIDCTGHTCGLAEGDNRDAGLQSATRRQVGVHRLAVAVARRPSGRASGSAPMARSRCASMGSTPPAPSSCRTGSGPRSGRSSSAARSCERRPRSWRPRRGCCARSTRGTSRCDSALPRCACAGPARSPRNTPRAAGLVTKVEHTVSWAGAAPAGYFTAMLAGRERDRHPLRARLRHRLHRERARQAQWLRDELGDR